MINKLKKYHRDYEMTYHGFLIMEDIYECTKKMYNLEPDAYSDSVYIVEEIYYYLNLAQISCFFSETDISRTKKWVGFVNK